VETAVIELRNLNEVGKIGFWHGMGQIAALKARWEYLP
jgi:hypothetical protein